MPTTEKKDSNRYKRNAAVYSGLLFQPIERAKHQINFAADKIERYFDGIETATDIATDAEVEAALADLIAYSLHTGYLDAMKSAGGQISPAFGAKAKARAKERAAKVAKKMKATTKKGYKADSDFMLSGDRALRAARYEAARGYFAGVTTAFGGQPVNKTWHTTSEEPCDECLLGDVLVRVPPFWRTYKRQYNGPIVDVMLSNEQQLSGSPNHPVLTDVGWKPLGELQESDYLIDGSCLNRIGFAATDLNDVPTRMDEIVDLFEGAEATYTCAADYFHGDGKASQIYVVKSDSLLRHAFELFRQHLVQPKLAIGPEAFERFAAVSSCSMRGYGHFLFDAACSVGVSDHIDLFSLTNRMAAANKRALDSAPIDAKLSSDLAKGLAAVVQLDDCSCVQGYSKWMTASRFRKFVVEQFESGRLGSDFATCSLDHSFYRACIESCFLTDEMKSQAAFVHASNVIGNADGIAIRSISHRLSRPGECVYNLSTFCGVYSAAGVLLSNCYDAEDDGPIPFDEPFSNGSMSPPHHLSCQCWLGVSK